MTLPVLPFKETFLLLMLAMLARYFVLAGIFHYSLSKKEEKKGQNIADIKWSVLSTFVFAFAGTILIKLWQKDITRIYVDINDFGIFYFVLSFPLFLFLQDTYFYWTHRLLHRRSLFRFHKAHHYSVAPTAWTSFAFHPVEACIQAMFLPVFVLILPVHWMVLLGLLMFMTVFGLLNHLGHEFCPRFFETKLGLITANHHQHHHENFHKNFGLYFTWWDHLMKSEGVRSE